VAGLFFARVTYLIDRYVADCKKVKQIY